VKKGISYFGVRNPEWVAKDLATIKDGGIDYVVHTFSEEDMEFYLDTMRKIVRTSKEMGLEVYLDPWGVARIFGGEAYSKFLLLNDDARLVTREGKKGYGACMNNPDTLEFMKNWVDAAYYAGGDYIFWDEPHFSLITNKDGCFCNICGEKFKEEFGEELKKATPEDLSLFRGLTKLNFLKEVMEYSHIKGMKNVLCLLPHDEDLEWEKFAEIKFLDVFGTDPYWVLKPVGFENWMKTRVEKVSKLSRRFGKESEIWIQNFKVRKGEEVLMEKVANTAMAYGIDRISAWSFRGTSYMSYIQSEDPEGVWKKLLEIYSKI